MGIEVIAFLVLTQLYYVSDFLERNAALLFFLSLFLVLWLTGVITTVRRWRAE
jgi:hypothetical protein